MRSIHGLNDHLDAVFGNTDCRHHRKTLDMQFSKEQDLDTQSQVSIQQYTMH